MDKTLELIRLAKEGNQDAKEQLITENLGLVWAVARRFLGRGHELEDLYQIGCIGLIKCVEKFDLSYEVKFSTYAVPMISGEIKRFLRDDGMIKVSRSLKETAYKVHRVREEVMNQTGLEPGISEIARILQLEEEEIVASLEACVEVESIQKVLYQNEGSNVCLQDKLTSEGDENEQLLNHILVEGLLEQLDDLEQKIIRLRYFENRTQTEIAGQVGISQVQVSRLEKRCLRKLRGLMQGEA
jgi:RNA polymerase sporulation-specific sigma factor